MSYYCRQCIKSKYPHIVLSCSWRPVKIVTVNGGQITIVIVGHERDRSNVLFRFHAKTPNGEENVKLFFFSDTWNRPYKTYTVANVWTTLVKTIVPPWQVYLVPHLLTIQVQIIRVPSKNNDRTKFSRVFKNWSIFSCNLVRYIFFIECNFWIWFPIWTDGSGRIVYLH